MRALSGVRIPNTFVPPLTRWGVSAEADLVYRTLVEFGPRMVSELSRSLGLAAPRIRDALDELAATGAAHPPIRASDARSWVASPPATTLPRLRSRHMAAARARFQLSRHLIALSEVGDLVGTADLSRLDAVRALHGVSRVRARVGELMARTRHEMLSMHPEPAFDAATVGAAAPADRALVARGVALDALGVPAAADDASTAHGRDMLALGVRYRELPVLPMKLLIFDRTTVLLPADPADPAKGALEVTARSALTGFVLFFLRRWGDARPPQPGAILTMKLTPRERAVVRLLAEGHTDASASKLLGLSVRTIAYTLRSLMDRHGAQNRFQLGLLIGAYAQAEVPPPIPPTNDSESGPSDDEVEEDNR